MLSSEGHGTTQRGSEYRDAGRGGTPGTGEETGSETDTSAVHLHLISHFSPSTSTSFLLLHLTYSIALEGDEEGDAH